MECLPVATSSPREPARVPRRDGHYCARLLRGAQSLRPRRACRTLLACLHAPGCRVLAMGRFSTLPFGVLLRRGCWPVNQHPRSSRDLGVGRDRLQCGGGQPDFRRRADIASVTPPGGALLPENSA